MVSGKGGMTARSKRSDRAIKITSRSGSRTVWTGYASKRVGMVSAKTGFCMTLQMVVVMRRAAAHDKPVKVFLCVDSSLSALFSIRYINANRSRSPPSFMSLS